MKMFSLFFAAVSGVLVLAASPGDAQIRLLDEGPTTGERRYDDEGNRYDRERDRERYDDQRRYDDQGSFASQYPADEVQAVPFARARKTLARSELRLAENALGAAVKNARIRFERSSEYQEAVEEERRAYDSYLAQRQLALQSIKDEPRYLSAMELREDLTKQIAEYRDADEPDMQQIVSLAVMKLKFAAVASEIEGEAIRSNPRIAQARADLNAASARVSEMRDNFAYEVRENEEILAARKNLDMARTQYSAASAFLDSAIRARNIAVHYAYYLHRDDRYRYSKYYDDYYDYDDDYSYRYGRFVRY